MTKDKKKLNHNLKNSIILLGSGTFLEYFDFMLYVHMAVLLNELFFPKYDSFTASLLAAFTFSVSFVFRIIGGFIFGYVGDKKGRKRVIIITTLLMSVACSTMAVLPTYAQIGITAGYIMIGCRILQSISSIGELLGASIYLLETVRQRPLQYSAVSSMAIFSSLGGFGALAFCNFIFSFGLSWRLAFLGGSIIAVISFFCRKKLIETPEFLNSQRTGEEILKNLKVSNKYKKLAIKSEILHDTIIKPDIDWKTMFNYSFIEAPYAVFQFIIIIHCSLILKDSFFYTPEQIIKHNLIIAFIGLIKYCVIVYLCYKIYPLLLFKIRLIILTIFTLFLPYLLDRVSNPLDLMLIQAFLIFFIPTSSTGLAIFFSYIPVAHRFRGVSLTFATSRAIIYLVTSFGLVYLIEYCGNYGIFVVTLPVLALTFCGLHHFYVLERKRGVDTTQWINSPSIYKENFLQPWYQKKKNTEKLIKFVTK